MVYFAVDFANHRVRKGFSMRSFRSFLRQAPQDGTLAFGALLNSFSRFCGCGAFGRLGGAQHFFVLTFMQLFRQFSQH